MASTQLLVKKLHPDAQLPVCAHPGEDLGYDIFSIEDVFLEPFKQAIVKTGIAARFVEAPSGISLLDALYGGTPRASRQYGLEVEDCSGMAAKKGLHVMAGKIDAGWKDEVGVVMILIGHCNELSVHPEDVEGYTDLGWKLEDAATHEMDMVLRLRGQGVRLGYQVRKGNRIAQLLPREILTQNPAEEVDELPQDGVRGLNGYGSTGK